MEPIGPMTKAVVVDVYRTVLEVLPGPVDAEARWADSWRGRVGHAEACPCLEKVSLRCAEIVAGDHAVARAAGIAWPEVVWREVMVRALPELGRLDERGIEDFLYEHVQLLREVRLMDGAAEFLRACVRRGIPLGIASNAQVYTLRELGEALAEAGLEMEIFERELCAWSFENGFSKPDAHVFRMLTARLAHRGIRPEEVLMVGDRMDNDIEPARAQGWRTWLLREGEKVREGETRGRGDAGNWGELADWLFR